MSQRVEPIRREVPSDATAIDDGGSWPRITAESLGSSAFKADYGLRYAYVAGAMYKGISSMNITANTSMPDELPNAKCSL